MVYQIYYTPKDTKEDKRYVIFDIEYYLSKYDMNEINNWISEIRCLTCVKGVTKFLKDKLNDKDFNYKVFGKVLEEKIEAFANKYGLYINRD